MQITPTALNFLKTKANKKMLFLELKAKGCNGFSWSLEPINTIEVDQSVHTIHRFDGLWIAHFNDEKLVDNLLIDLNSDFLGDKITFTIPEATSHCGCNKSFGI